MHLSRHHGGTGRCGAEVIWWSGWGILALPLFALGALGGTSLGLALGVGEGDLATGAGPNLGTATGVALASTAVWFLGQRLNRARNGFDPRTGQPIRIANQHSLFFIPIQYLGPLGGALSIVFAVQALTS